MDTWVVAGLGFAYSSIFLVGVTGNMLVVFIILLRNFFSVKLYFTKIFVIFITLVREFWSGVNSECIIFIPIANIKKTDEHYENVKGFKDSFSNVDLLSILQLLNNLQKFDQIYSKSHIFFWNKLEVESLYYRISL